GPAAEAPPPRTAATPQIPVPSFLEHHPAEPGAPREKSSLEALVAGRGLQLAGLLLVLLGTAFFLDLAFTSGWIGPAQRIILGLVAGSALIGAGARLLRGTYTYLAEGLVGLGAGILYLSLWASVAVFPQLHVARPAAFAAMIAVTAVVAALAALRRSERLALIGLVGGFLTPVLLSGGPTAHVELATYLLVLAGGMLALAARCGFRSVEAVTFVATFLYAGAFSSDPATQWSDRNAYAVASLFFVEFALAFGFGAARSGAASPIRIALLSLDVALYAGFLEIIFANHQTPLGVALLALAVVLLATAQLRTVPQRMTAACGYLGLAVVTLALPALIHQTSLLDAFSLEAGVLVVLGRRAGDRWIALAGALLFGLTGIALFAQAQMDPPATAFLNPLAYAFAIWIGALIAARKASASSAVEGDGAYRTLDVTAGIALNAIVLTALSRQLLDALGGPQWNVAVPNNAQLALSLLWTVYAATLFAFGLRGGSAAQRWQGLVLFALTLCKVFFVDLATLNSAYRVGSFVGLGIVMVAASAWYTRATMRRSTPEAEA
ncbi:MAG: rane protein, partial [Candidatus Eremiobacteraeota bacterium]|nr:rane protein [Candidatus Eremiobacteraeota bacterium]